MDKVNVLIAHYFGRPADADAIAAVDPRVEVAYAPYVDARAREMMRSYQAGGTMTFEGDPGEFDRRIGEAEVVLGAGLPKNLLELAPNLKWVQAYGAGVDYLAGTGLLEHGVALTSSSGINGPPIAESCLMFMIMNEKSMVKRVEAQSRREWTRYANGQLTGKTVGIVGPGSIGGGVAKRAAACDMRVLAARRTYVPGQAVPNVDEVFPSDRINEMLAQCDYVVVAVSLTEETRGMIGKAQFDAMKARRLLHQRLARRGRRRSAAPRRPQDRPPRRRGPRRLRPGAPARRQRVLGPPQRDRDPPQHRRPQRPRRPRHPILLREPTPLPRRNPPRKPSRPRQRLLANGGRPLHHSRPAFRDVPVAGKSH